VKGTLWVVGALSLLALPGCGPGVEAGDGQALTVLAASSLTGVFEQLAEDFETDHAGVEVRLSFGSSATLAQQVVEGAPGDVLATADLTTMAIAEDGDGVTAPRAFASNLLVLVTPEDDAGGIDDLADLERPGVDYLTCVESAPCGALAQSLLERNGVAAQPVSQEADVRAVLTKVESGEADAGFVYATDAREAGDRVRTIQVPHAVEELTTCAVAVTTQAQDAALAMAWVELVTSEQGRAVLARAGFGAAPVDP